MYFNAHTFAIEQAIFTLCYVCTTFVWYHVSGNQYLSKFDCVTIGTVNLRNIIFKFDTGLT